MVSLLFFIGKNLFGFGDLIMIISFTDLVIWSWIVASTFSTSQLESQAISAGFWWRLVVREALHSTSIVRSID